MEYTKIKKAAKLDPQTEFVISQYSGTPSSRWAKKAVLVNSDKHKALVYPGYHLDATGLANQLSAPEYKQGEYGVLARISDLDGTNEYYSVIPTRWVKGLYLDYKEQWAKQITIEAKIDELENQIRKVKKQQEHQHAQIITSKVQSVKDFLAKYAQWNGILANGNYWHTLEKDEVSLNSVIQIEFAHKDYPEFAAAGYSFNKDPDNFTIKTSGSVNVGIDLVENLMESMLAIQDENKALTIELEKVKRTNGN